MKPFSLFSLLLCILCIQKTFCDILPDGRGKTPLMGWRSWNLFNRNVNQSLMENIMSGMARRDRLVDGKPTSLCDVGYCDVGLDDNWQVCHHVDGQNSYHKEDGTPIVDLNTFPDLAAMNAHAHKLGLKSGWYGNNCICRERSTNLTKFYEGDAKATAKYSFDSIKLDGCGAQTNLQLWHDLLFKHNPNGVVIENCHWGRVFPAYPNKTWCPWSYYRTSGDIQANYGSMVRNLQTVTNLAREGLSRPGCWAYPDMLEVGIKLTHAESRAHFGAWCIVSSPLILSHDVNDDTVSDSIWDIITNKEAIEVNQAWAGHSGSPFASGEGLVELPVEPDVDPNQSPENKGKKSFAAPVYQYYYKPIKPNGEKTAILLMNHGSDTQTLSVSFSDIPGINCKKCLVRDIWSKRNVGVFDETFSWKVASHDAGFFTVVPADNEIVSAEIFSKDNVSAILPRNMRQARGTARGI